MSDEHRDPSRDQHPTDPGALADPGSPQQAQPGGPPPHGSPWGPPNTGPAAPPAAGPAWPQAPQPPGHQQYPHQNPYPTAFATPPNPGPPRQGRGMGVVVTAALLAGLVGGGAGFAGAYALTGGGSGPALVQQPGSSSSADLVPGSVGAAAAKAMPSTVDIQVQLPQGAAEGSGVVLTPDGNVLTNNHVVEGAVGAITVTLADGTERAATVVGTSPSYDLAVIKMTDARDLTPAVLGESSSLQVGQPVVAIGSPRGLAGTVTSGIISAFNRTVAAQGENGGSAVVYNGLQTDTAINPGNSGGPLINLDGQVIGINSAIAGNNSTGLGFAIPIDQAKRVAEEIMSTGSATKPVLGVQSSPANASPAADRAGARIGQVVPGSPAAAAGLAPGDVVTKVGEEKVEDFIDLVARIGSYAPGQEVPLTVVSGGVERTVTIALGSQPDTGAITATPGGGD